MKEIEEILLLNGTLVDCPGLIQGKTGIAIFFFHYARYTGNELFEDYAMEIIGEIQTQIHVGSSADYERGIAGIGVGIDYLVRNKFLEADDDLFEDFDQRMYRAVMYDPWIDFSLYDGLTGYGRYWLCRWNENHKRANEAIIYILNSIEHDVPSAITVKEQQDIYCFLHDLSKLPEYEKKAKSLIKKIGDNHTGLPASGFYRLDESLIKNPLNMFLGNEYFNLSVDDLNQTLTEIQNPGTTENMGIFKGYAGYGLCRLTLCDSQQSGWMKLM